MEGEEFILRILVMEGHKYCPLKYLYNCHIPPKAVTVDTRSSLHYLTEHILTVRRLSDY